MINNAQFTKLFDHKFVAYTLKNYHRCGKCHNEFSSWHDAPDKHLKDVRSNRPVLLPCGHNMCENCVYHNRQHLMCAVCLKPVELSDQQLQQTQQFHLRENFDMNFYFLGKLSNFRYYFKDGLNNSTLLATSQTSAMSISNTLGGGSSAVVPTIKCTECELVPAMGKCRQCKVYMCKRCFDNIHKGSKVLQMHSLQHLDKATKATDIDRLIKPRFCKRHQRTQDRFCQKCNTTCCTECAKNDHYHHSCKTLLEVNKNQIDGVNATLQNVRTCRENVKKALKVVCGMETLTYKRNDFFSMVNFGQLLGNK